MLQVPRSTWGDADPCPKCGAFASDWGPRSAHRAAWASGFVDVVAESAYDLVRSALFSFIFVGTLLGSACPR